jgi:hypothetical protein
MPRVLLVPMICLDSLQLLGTIQPVPQIRLFGLNMAISKEDGLKANVRGSLLGQNVDIDLLVSEPGNQLSMQ